MTKLRQSDHAPAPSPGTHLQNIHFLVTLISNLSFLFMFFLLTKNFLHITYFSLFLTYSPYLHNLLTSPRSTLSSSLLPLSISISLSLALQSQLTTKPLTKKKQTAKELEQKQKQDKLKDENEDEEGEVEDDEDIDDDEVDDDDDDDDDDDAALQGQGQGTFGLDSEIPDIRDEDLMLRRNKAANAATKRPGTATSRMRPTTGRSRRATAAASSSGAPTTRNGRDGPGSSMLNRREADADDSSFGSTDSELDVGDIMGLSGLSGNAGTGDDDFDLNSIDDISISKLTGEIPLRPKTASKPEHHSDEDF